VSSLMILAPKERTPRMRKRTLYIAGECTPEL
jgi:hypothetical protein